MEDIVVIMPVYNDWTSSTELIKRIDRVARDNAGKWTVLTVDDGSTEDPPSEMDLEAGALESAGVIRLRRNLGHQRAIAVALAHVHDRIPCKAVVVMDGDGEDAPEDIPKLLERFRLLDGKRVVFAKRARRQEQWLFQFFLLIFKIVHRILTGRRVEVGNFSVISFEHLERLVSVSEVWNHYAASVFKAKIPMELVPIDRARRIAGQSRMDFVALAAHGLSAMSVYADTVGVRLLMGTLTMVALTLLGLAALVFVVLGTRLAVPGWGFVVAGALLLVLSQAVIMSFLFVFIALHGRHNLAFLPIRDYSYFVQSIDRITLRH